MTPPGEGQGHESSRRIRAEAGERIRNIPANEPRKPRDQKRRIIAHAAADPIEQQPDKRELIKICDKDFIFLRNRDILRVFFDHIPNQGENTLI